MKQQNVSEIFDFLDRNAHRVNEAATSTLFPEIYGRHDNDTQYWLYSDLRRRFPEIHYDPTQNMYEFLQSRMTYTYFTKGSVTPVSAKDFINIFYRSIEIIPSTRSQNDENAKLTRYACAAITRTPETAFAHAYFILPDADYDARLGMGYNLLRLARRKQMAAVEKTISGILHAHKIDFGRFGMMANMALFCEASTSELKMRHNITIKPGDPITNYMQHTSLGARLYAMKSAISEYNAHRVQRPEIFENIVRQNLEKARMLMIQNYGRAPENDLSRTPISAVQSKYGQIWRDFCARYANETLR